MLFRIQMPACLHGGSQVALWSKMKGTATPRGVSACAEQTSASSAPQVKTRDNLRKAAVEPAKPPILSRAKTERVELEDTGAQSTDAADESPPLGFPPENDYMCRFNILYCWMWNAFCSEQSCSNFMHNQTGSGLNMRQVLLS